MHPAGQPKHCFLQIPCDIIEDVCERIRQFVDVWFVISWFMRITDSLVVSEAYMEVQGSLFFGWVSAAAMLVFGLFGVANSRQERLKLTLSSFCLGLLGGILSAKLVYYLCQIDFMIAEGWKEKLFCLDPEELSFFGGAAGLCLGVALAAKICNLAPISVLNRFAPFALLLGALVRFGEYFLGMVGVGPYLENEALCFFPLARGFSYSDDWTEWYLAVFVLEGISLLAVAAVSYWKLKDNRFLRSVFYFCLPQILLENLRLGSFMWFFCIRVEQLACMVTMFIILIIYGVRSHGKPNRFLPAGIAILCAGLFIVCEFAMEGKILFLRFLDIYACYALMLAGQVILAVTEVLAFRKMLTVQTEGKSK